MTSPHVVKEPTPWSIDRAGIRGKLFPAQGLITRTEHLLIETENGHTTTIVERESDFIYYILEGAGQFVIDGVSESCSQGDLVVVPRGLPFTYRGRLRMFLTCSPPWDPAQETTL